MNQEPYEVLVCRLDALEKKVESMRESTDVKKIIDTAIQKFSSLLLAQQK